MERCVLVEADLGRGGRVFGSNLAQGGGGGL